MKRSSLVTLIAGFVGLGTLATACQDKPNDMAGGGLTGSDAVEIIHANFVSLGSSAGQNYGGGQAYLWIVKMKLTNTFGPSLVPTPAGFVLLTIDGVRYQGIDSGESALIGISNDYGAMKRDESRVFTVGFRCYQQTQGQIGYEPG